MQRAQQQFGQVRKGDALGKAARKQTEVPQVQQPSPKRPATTAAKEAAQAPPAAPAVPRAGTTADKAVALAAKQAANLAAPVPLPAVPGAGEDNQPAVEPSQVSALSHCST